MTSEDERSIRLQKVLSRAGVASRRAAEDLIVQGRVRVDGSVVRELGTRVDPDSAVIHVDDTRVVVRADMVYLALNKPRGMHTTMVDERGRPCVGDLVAGRAERLFHVGRLDADTEGLLLLTNDGELAHRLMHPSYEVFKTYLVEVEGSVPRKLCNQLLAGVQLEDGPVKPDRCRVVDTLPGRTLVEVVLHEGRKRIVRRMFAEVGHPVVRLVRTAFGSVQLGDTKPGELRELTRDEQGALFRTVEL
ncbi:23S rRNA pseudouridine2605 synthase [Haloechinothrix alba]|uniref:Pseudouridine synthase n=1 Tax=Haloechinothrix alba TaxID=664784 RepID=A0A238ZUV4_9PSEU|nr:pseudouridine synthase [Haloechinothrix alba]SNR87105.1 23S rRNA pseudouridine2605 synthase [Haloechinothrix alba]